MCISLCVIFYQIWVTFYSNNDEGRSHTKIFGQYMLLYMIVIFSIALVWTTKTARINCWTKFDWTTFFKTIPSTFGLYIGLHEIMMIPFAFFDLIKYLPTIFPPRIFCYISSTNLCVQNSCHWLNISILASRVTESQSKHNIYPRPTSRSVEYIIQSQ